MYSVENASFDPDPVTPHSNGQSHLRPVCRWLTYSSSSDIDTSGDEAPSPSTNPQIAPHKPDTQPATLGANLDVQIHLEEDEEEDFQQYPWMMNIGVLKKYLTGLYVYMKMPYHMDCACTHAPM